MLLHFPVALWPADFIFSSYSLYAGNSSLAHAAYFCLFAGVAGGWIAILAGFVDLYRFRAVNEKMVTTAIVHASIQMMVTLGFTIILSVERKNELFITAPPGWLLVLKAILLSAMLVGNYLGGNLLLKFVSRKYQR